MSTTTRPVLDIRHMKRRPTHPGEILLEEFLRPLGLSQAGAARRMRVSASCLNAMIHKKRRVTARTALRLAKFLHTSPGLWLNLQAGWDLWHAHRAGGRNGIGV